LSNIRATHAIVAKNDAIVATTRAADAWNEYDSRSIRQHIYEAAIVTAPASQTAHLRGLVAHEKAAAAPTLQKARGLEEEAERYNARSERLLGAHETLEIATTHFEISIVLVTMTALVGGRLLPLVAGIASTIGIVILIVGILH
jgi:hypothetical protein